MICETKDSSSWSVDPDKMCIECLVLRKEGVTASKEGVGESDGGGGRLDVGTSLSSCCMETGVSGGVESCCGSAWGGEGMVRGKGKE